MKTNKFFFFIFFSYSFTFLFILVVDTKHKKTAFTQVLTSLKFFLCSRGVFFLFCKMPQQTFTICTKLKNSSLYVCQRTRTTAKQMCLKFNNQNEMQMMQIRISQRENVNI